MNFPSQIANRYLLEEQIGQGGMGIVFRGHDSLTDQPVAIKVLKSDVIKSNPAILERFLREAEALRQLNHPNIITIHQMVEEDGQHYLVMEYVPGGSLRDLIENTPQIPLGQVLNITLDLADALTRAHRLDIIHRDIKPENILIAEDGTPRLTDFGLARIGGRSRVTESKNVIGTFAYLSPEACMGELDLDQRTDIWSFGIVLYELLSGQLPFQESNPAAMITAILAKPIPDLDTLRPGLPIELLELIDQMLTRELNERLDSVRLVGANLERLLMGLDVSGTEKAKGLYGKLPTSRFATPISSFSTTIKRSLTKSTRQKPGGRRIWLAIGGLLLVGIIAGLVFGLDVFKSGVARVESVEPGEYMVLVAQLEPLETVDDDVTRFLVDDLKQRLEIEIPFSNIRIREYPAVITDQTHALEAAQVNQAAVVIWGRYDEQSIELEIQLGSLAEFPDIMMAQELIERTANARVRMSDVKNESVAYYVLDLLNVIHMADGNAYEVARTSAIQSEVNITNAEIMGDSIAAYLLRYSRFYYSEPQLAVDEITSALTLDARNPLLYIYRGAAYARDGLYDNATEDIRTAARLGPENWIMPLYLEGNMYLPGGISATGDPEKALELYNQILDQRPDDWLAWSVRCSVDYLQHEYDAAEVDCDRAIELNPPMILPYPYATAVALRNGQINEAAAFVKIVVQDFPDPYYTTRIMQTYQGNTENNPVAPFYSAYANLALGQYQQVIQDTNLVLEITQLADVYLVQGLAYCNLGKYDDALDSYNEGINLEPDYVVLYLLRSEIYTRQGNMEALLSDVAVIQQSPLNETLSPYVQAGIAGDFSCETFFDFDYESILEE